MRAPLRNVTEMAGKRTVSTQNLSMQILLDTNKDTVGALGGKNDLLHRKAI